jgi:hypothetical protein
MAASVGLRGSTTPALRTEKGGGLVSAKIQASLIVLGMVVLAALNGSSPWGP